MEREPVTSSNVESVGYDDATMTLEVEFKDGAVYQYFDVPENVHAEFVGASSVGSYLAREIKGKYRYVRL